MNGILLAGGAATRLPNKPLLPQRDLQPVCFSGVSYLLRHKARYITVVVPPGSAIPDILEYNWPSVDFAFIYQGEATGVGDALNLITPEHSMIVMADNIYPVDETVPLDPQVTYTVMRHVPGWRIGHLVRTMSVNGYLTRNGPGFYALTTPWHVSQRFWIDLKPHGFMREAWQNFHHLGIEKKADGWWDVGTPDTYAAYWRS